MPPLFLDLACASCCSSADPASVPSGGGNPASWAITSDSIIALAARAPFTEWRFRGVVGNASQFQGARDGYSEGPNENALVLLADNKTLLAVWRNEAEAPPATAPAGACDECSYTRALSTDRGRTWHDHRFLPPGVGAVTPELLLMRHPSGRAGPLLLSGGRANTSHLTGNLTSHNVNRQLSGCWHACWSVFKKLPALSTVRQHAVDQLGWLGQRVGTVQPELPPQPRRCPGAALHVHDQRHVAEQLPGARVLRRDIALPDGAGRVRRPLYAT